MASGRQAPLRLSEEVRAACTLAHAQVQHVQRRRKCMSSTLPSSHVASRDMAVTSFERGVRQNQERRPPSRGHSTILIKAPGCWRWIEARSHRASCMYAGHQLSGEFSFSVLLHLLALFLHVFRVSLRLCVNKVE